MKIKFLNLFLLIISDKAMQLSFKKSFSFSTKYFFKLLRNFITLTPIRCDGIIPTSDKTEYLPPKKFLCSIKGRLYFFEIVFKIFSFFSVIIIIFLAFDFNIFNSIKFDIVSIVFPDFEITIKRHFFLLFSLLNFLIFSPSSFL